MILVRKNVYKDVLSFENVFQFCKMFESVCDCFENRKDVLFEIEQVIRSKSTYSKGLRCSFPPPLDVVILPFFW